MSNKTAVTYRLPDSLLERLDRYAESSQQTKTAIVTAALDAHLPSNPGQKRPFKDQDMQITIHSQGQQLQQHAHDSKLFVEAPDIEGQEYVIMLRNNTPERQLAVVSVDGLNVMDGKPAAMDQGGYVLEPFQVTTIKGWRRNNNEVAAFTFSSMEKSYSNQMGHGQKNVGVIGLAVFAEKRSEGGSGSWAWSMGGRQHGSHSGGIAAKHDSWGATGQSASRSNRSVVRRRRVSVARTEKTSGQLGTGYGDRKEMKVRTTTFERCSETPVQVTTLHYATRAQLIEWGVIQPGSEANPFPANTPSTPAPPGWQG